MHKSQWGQDRFLDEKIFRGKKHGIYVDVGAHDGVTGSNTFFFEKERQWTGICIEPLDRAYVELVKNRSSESNTFQKCCVYSQDGTVNFVQNTGYTEMLSGIVSTYDPRHTARLQREQKSYGGNTQVQSKPALTLTSILGACGIKHIDYLSVDTEGSEYEVLAGLDFDRVSVRAITVENNYPDTFGNIHELLENNGFKHCARLGGDEVYVGAANNNHHQ